MVQNDWDIDKREIRKHCIVCGSSRLSNTIELYDQELEGSSYQLVSCHECRHEFIANPVKRETIFHHYPTDNSAYSSELGTEIAPVKRFLFWLDSKLLLSHLKPGDSIFDVGAGLGTFAQYLKNQGFQIAVADFVDKDAWPRNEMKYLKLDLNQMEKDGADLQANLGFVPRAIVMRHVLEHVYDPLAVLKNLSSLSPEFILIIVPNGNSWLRKLFGRHWGFYDPPRHLSNFNRSSLSKALDLVGYRTIGTETYGMDECITSIYRAGRNWNPKIRRYFSWTSIAMLISSGLSLLFLRSVIITLAKRK